MPPITTDAGGQHWCSTCKTGPFKTLHALRMHMSIRHRQRVDGTPLPAKGAKRVYKKRVPKAVNETPAIADATLTTRPMLHYCPGCALNLAAYQAALEIAIRAH